MSWNLMVAVEQAEHNDEVWPMMLTRASGGITHSATIAVDDVIEFPNGVRVRITSIVHQYQPPGSGKAPNSYAYAITEQPLLDNEIEQLRAIGFMSPSETEAHLDA